MDDREKFNEISFPGKEEFCSNLNMADIIDADYMYLKRACKDSEINKLGKHDFYFRNDTV